MTRDIMLKDVPVILKLSTIIKELERYGDITRASVDEKRRRDSDNVNIFIGYSERVGATRALADGKINIGGNVIKIEASTTQTHFGSEKQFRIIRSGPIKAVERFRHRNSRSRSRSPNISRRAGNQK